MTAFERTCWRVTIKLLIQIASLLIGLAIRQGIPYDMMDELREARRVVKELKGGESNV